MGLNVEGKRRGLAPEFIIDAKTARCQDCDEPYPRAGNRFRCEPCRAIRNSPEFKKAYWSEYGQRPEVREHNRRKGLARRYGMTIEQYDAMSEAQGGVCAICKREPEGTSRWGRLHVDHDHDTGEIRGLLCAPCNTALGKFKTTEVLMAAIAYLGSE